jgi:hypothetical protein
MARARAAQFSPNPVIRSAAAGEIARLKPEYFAGSEYGNYTRDEAGNIKQVIAPAPVKSTAPSAIQEAEWYRTATPDQKVAYNDAKAAGRPVTTIVMPKPENAFGASLGAELGKDVSESIKAGRKAPESIQSANRVINILSNPKIAPITGAFADTKLAISKALYGDTASAAATENLEADLAKSTLDVIHNSGLGAGQGFTNSDRDFLEKAQSGKITKTRENLLRLAQIRKATGIAAINKANNTMSAITQMKGYENMGDILAPIEYDSNSLGYIEQPTAPAGTDSNWHTSANGVKFRVKE